MGILRVESANRLGFLVLGLSINFVIVSMISAAFDMLSESTVDSETLSSSRQNSSSLPEFQKQQSYCNDQSTSTILLAVITPSLVIKIIYPFLLVSVPSSYNAVASALFAAAAFAIVGLFTSQILIFTGVICASLSFGLGESTFMSMTPLYGDSSLSGWSIGSGLACFFSSLTYALLRMILSIQLIMLSLLVVPILMMVAFFQFIKPVDISPIDNFKDNRIESFNFRSKLNQLSTLAKYFFPLLLVYFAEYFINQGLYEIIYYPEIEYLDHAAQYRWFQVAYRWGSMIALASMELVQFKNIWAMSLLQAANAILFLAHTMKLIHIPSFYLVITLISYEGFLGGLTYVNTFNRIKQETPKMWQEFSISTVTIAVSLGVMLAGLVALPMHETLCQLYV